ncbi:hypothetical protein T440DRAFT_46162 [Plenodomus tracheiphilus IPT5]|uniref:Uncharacterized protein n=1 Tax=Plenodomus tracheiphilus IPT5 TaxID=1408161 RepID=A0A6A7B9I4_9PLEO|nr:hypothetical protein T440DRAFT_46162 [Plenodomus tracheiphilus IPT5]
MSPPYIFQINEVNRNPRATCRYDNFGRWIPSYEGAGHEIYNVGATGKYWYCDRSRFYRIDAPPIGSTEYSTFSLYYGGGHGFWVLKGSAINPPRHDDWHALKFDHSPSDYSSFLTNAGQQDTLRCQRSDQTWPQMLLPDIYRTTSITQHQQYGGLTGELPILLGLMAHTTTRDSLPIAIPYMFQNQTWQEHMFQYQRTENRGVIVTVYTCPESWAGGSTMNDLIAYERGDFGKYFR